MGAQGSGVRTEGVDGTVMDKRYCLEIAREVAQAFATSHPEVVGIFACGSMTTTRPVKYADVDLRVILDAAEMPTTQYVIERDVPLEWVFVPYEKCQRIESLLESPFLGPELARGIILVDPTGFLERTQESVRSVYQRPGYVRARARRLWEAAFQMLASARSALGCGEPVSSWELRCLIFWTGEVPLLLLNKVPNHKRLLVQLREMQAHLGTDQPYRLGLRTLGAEDLTAVEASGFLLDVLRMIDAIDAWGLEHHFHLSQEKRPYWEIGIGELIDRGDHREATLPLLTLVSTAAPLMEQVPEAGIYRAFCHGFLDRLGFVDPGDLRRKLDVAEEWLSLTEMLIERATPRRVGRLIDVCQGPLDWSARPPVPDLGGRV